MIFVNGARKIAIADKLTFNVGDAHRIVSDGFKLFLPCFRTGITVLG